MNYDQFQEVARGLQSPFWTFLKEQIEELSSEKKELGVSMIPDGTSETIEREQLFGASKALTELLELVPSRIKDKLKQLEKDSQTNEKK